MECLAVKCVAPEYKQSVLEIYSKAQGDLAANPAPLRETAFVAFVETANAGFRTITQKTWRFPE